MYIINADDYGISEENNLAILEASKFGILNSTSVMVNTPFCNYNILQELLNNEIKPYMSEDEYLQQEDTLQKYFGVWGSWQGKKELRG